VKRLPDMPLAQADILDLPVRPDGVDLAVARGVIMTTGNPRRAFHELVRVTRPGGMIFVRLYHRRNAYHWAYRILGPVCRGIARVPGGKTALALVAIPPFWLVLQLFVLVLRGRPVGTSPRVLWNFFADQLLVPHNSFHTLDEVIGWGVEEGCRCDAHGVITLGQQIELLFVKETRPAPGAASPLAP
jgi:SAM-dependent methyltransferase